MKRLSPDQLFDDFRSSFQQRKFSAGLLISFIDFFVELSTPNLGISSFDDFLNYHRCLGPEGLFSERGGNSQGRGNRTGVDEIGRVCVEDRRDAESILLASRRCVTAGAGSSMS